MRPGLFRSCQRAVSLQACREFARHRLRNLIGFGLSVTAKRSRYCSQVHHGRSLAHKAELPSVRCSLRTRGTVQSGYLACGLVALWLAISPPIPSAPQSHDSREDTSLLRVDSAFVWVLALVKTKGDWKPTQLEISRLRLLDDRNPEKVTQIDTDGLPISLVILMQTGGLGEDSFRAIPNLPWLMGRLVGASAHEVTFVTFDSRVRQIWHFPTRTDGAIKAMTHQHPGDEGAAIKDAI